MLTGFTWCIPLKTETVEEVMKAYMDHIYSNFGGSIKILMNNGTEFKNKLFKEVVEKLGTEFSIHLPPYRPQSNGKIEGFHRFLKTCIGKHINYGLEWNELTPMATACYNFFPNCNARESAFFVIARSFCSQFGGGLFLLFSALFGITFAIMPEVSITLVMQ